MAIVGSGPAGFYTAKYLLEKNKEVNVDIIEKLPVPYGLVRYGVAPDHPEVKSVQDTFEKVATNPRFRFFGNVELEQDAAHLSTSESNWMVTKSGEEEKDVVNKVTLEELKRYYKGGVVLACGAENDRKLGLAYEDECHGVLSARSFVNWYNGHPDFTHIGDSLDLTKIEDVVIIGQGNVALDCARILTKSTEELAATDLCEHALVKLRDSAVKQVHVVGRRGTAQAAFTIKELRELTRLDGVSCNISPADMEESMTDASKAEVGSNRAKTRINDLIQSIVDTPAGEGGDDREIHLRFLLQPEGLETEQQPLPFEVPIPLDAASKVELEVAPIESSSVGAKTFEPRRARVLTGVTFARTSLVGEAGAQRALVRDGGESVTVPAQLLLKSVGYRSVGLKGVPFDAARAVVPHDKGRVVALAGDPDSDAGRAAVNVVDEEALMTKDGGMRQLSKTLRGMLGSEAEGAPAPAPALTQDAEPDAAAAPAVDRERRNAGPDSSTTPLYVVGWLKRGPSGTIASSVTDAKETAASVLADLPEGPEGGSGSGSGGDDADGAAVSGPDPAQRIAALRSSSAISWQRYRQIDAFEVAEGQQAQPARPRNKITGRETMIELKASLRKRAQDRARQSRQQASSAKA